MQRFEVVETKEQLDKLRARLNQLEVFAFDTETTGLNWVTSKVFLMSFAAGDQVWLVPVNRFAHLDMGAVLPVFLRDVFSDERKWVIGQNLKFDAHQVMASFGVRIYRQWHDTQLMAYLMNENRSNSLKRLMHPLLGVEPMDEEKIKGWMAEHQGKQELWDYSKVPEELMHPYSAMDAWATFKLYEKLKPEVDAHFLKLYNTDRQVLKILWKLEQNGVKLDVPQLQAFNESKKVEQAAQLQQVFQLIGRDVDVFSPKDLQKAFYEDLKLPIKFYTEKGHEPSTEDAALEAMNHPAARALQAFRGTTNQVNYAKGLLAKAGPDNVVHGDYSITRAATGRFACSDPNLQNVPKAKELRSCFVVDEGWDMFFLDHAQIEMVGFAHYSRDPKMMQALHSGQDLHQLAASEVYKLPLEQVTKAQRAVGKGTNFSIIYGVGKKKLATYINGYMPEGHKLTDTEAQAFKDQYMLRFPSVRRFQLEAQGAVRRKRDPWGHFIRNMFGRVRRIEHPEDWIDQDGKKKRGKAYTAVNHLVQGWAPDLMKQGMVEMDKLMGNELRWRQNVHDELRIDLRQSLTPDQRVAMVRMMVHCLTDFPEVRVPVKCKVEWSETSWAEVKPWAV